MENNLKTIISKHGSGHFNKISEASSGILPICQTHYLEKIVKVGHGHKPTFLGLLEHLSINGFNSVTHLM